MSRTKSRSRFAASSGLWKHYPWLCGLFLAPLLYGAVTPRGQIVVGVLFAISILLLSPQISGWLHPACPPALKWIGLICLVLPLCWLPVNLAEVMNPNRVLLAREFSVGDSSDLASVPIAFSPANTLQRLWEISLVISCFCLARIATAHHSFPRVLAMLIACAVFLQASLDLGCRMSGDNTVLGTWRHHWSCAAGTFANRNHFANWIVVGILFSAGWLMRSLRPLRSARLKTYDRPRSVDFFFLVPAISFGLMMAIASGSRGGAAALIAGTAIWAGLLAWRTQSRKRWLLVILGGSIAALLALTVSDHLMNRLAADRDPLSYRMLIWKDSLKILFHYPLFGVGPGGFVTAFSHYKTFGGGKTFVHAENDYVQLLVEMGLIGGLIAGYGLYRIGISIFQFIRASRIPEPELVFGAIAALLAFSIHALVEFVFQVTANALLAASLLGFVMGCRDRLYVPAVVPVATNRRILFNIGWACALLTAASLQALGMWHWKQALRAGSLIEASESVSRSLHYWPSDSQRQVALIRSQAQLLGKEPAEFQSIFAQPVRSQIARALRRDPFNWELRLERAWFELAYSGIPSLAAEYAMESVRLNPLQPKIPLQFASYLSSANPDLAMRFISAVAENNPGVLRDIFQESWSIKPDAAHLWTLTPDTPDCLLTLGDFAASKRLFSMAAQAYQLCEGKTNWHVLATKHLAIKRPDLALAVLPEAIDGSWGHLLAARVHAQAGNYAQSIRHSESAWQKNGRNGAWMNPQPVSSSFESLLAAVKDHETDTEKSRELAELIHSRQASNQDFAILHQLRKKHPRDERICWILYQAHLDKQQFKEAAETALSLAELSLASM